MPFAEAWLLGGAVSAFLAAVALVTATERQRARRFRAAAEAAGWTFHHRAPPGLRDRLADMLGLDVVPESELYLAGRHAGRPFELLRAGPPSRGHASRRRRDRWTFVHVRTEASCPSLRVVPADRFRFRDAPARDRLFTVTGAADRVGGAVRALLAQPRVPVRVAWIDRDLVVAFPLGTTSPDGARHLLGYASALADALTSRTRSRFSGRVAVPTRSAPQRSLPQGA